MARGWESKAVEAQQEEMAARQGGPPRSRDATQQTAHATLMLARTRALADLQRACVPAHRAMLEQAITALDTRLKALDEE